MKNDDINKRTRADAIIFKAIGPKIPNHIKQEIFETLHAAALALSLRIRKSQRN